MIKIKKTKKLGRGLFATESIPAKTVIEKSPLIVIPAIESVKFEDSTLGSYVYEFKDGLGIALGYGSLFNHNDNPNVAWKVLEKEKCILFWAIKDIPPDQQLFIDYGYDPLE